MNISPDRFASCEDPETLSRLRHRLGQAAEAEGLLDVAYTTIDSPVGPLLLAATPKGLVRVAYDVEDHDRVLSALSQRLSPRVLRAPGRQQGKHAVVVLGVVGHPHQALRRRRQQQRADGGVDRGVGDVEQALGLGVLAESAPEPRQRLGVFRGCEMVR